MKSNVSSFIPAGVGSTLSQIQNPTAFGDQLANQAKQQVIGVILGPIQKLKTEIEKVIRLIGSGVDTGETPKEKRQTIEDLQRAKSDILEGVELFREAAGL
jgi:hypothetical protein